MVFPKEYFEEEIREGFTVSEMMKSCWAATWEVLEIVVDICKKHQIPYFADWGTLLGAIRHKGFIPWDDDIDISLLRKDYERLLEALQQDLPDGFVVAGMYATEQRLREVAKAPQMRVIADNVKWPLPAYLNRFHGFPYPGVGIDIFPLDNIPDDLEQREIMYDETYHILEILTHWDEMNGKPYGKYAEYICKLEKKYNLELPTGDSLYSSLWFLEDMICSQYAESDTAYVAPLALNMYVEKERLIPKSAFEEAITVPFEHMSIDIPKGYDDVLRTEYGDYMTPVRGTAGHGYPLYAEQQEEMEKMFREAGIQNGVDEFCHNWRLMIQKYDL